MNQAQDYVHIRLGPLTLCSRDCKILTTALRSLPQAVLHISELGK